MDDIGKVISERLSQAFGKDTQEVTAHKLNTTQGNISKWVTGQQVPTTDFLLQISKAYEVSVDWILGLSDERDIDGIVYEKMTYEQAARIVDYLIKIGCIEVPNVRELHLPEEETTDSEETEFDEDEPPIEPPPVYDSDLIKIKDRALSHILRRRLKMYEIDEDYADLWRDNILPIFKGLKVVINSENMQAAIDTKNWSVFKDGDWVSTIGELSKLSEEELKAIVDAAQNKEKEGNSNG